MGTKTINKFYNISDESKGNHARDTDFPSTVTDTFWIFARVQKPQKHPRKFKATKSGKWLLFIDESKIDSIWQKIRNATEAGLLGNASKTATARPNPNAISENEKVICIYTYNWQDVADVYRVEKALRSIGIEETLYYKADSDTYAGKYKVTGSTGISKYISKGNKSYHKFSLASLNGIKHEKIKVLRKIGVKSFNDLLAFDTSKKLQGVGVSTEYINKLKLCALSQMEGKIFQIAPLRFPDENVVHFDIETDLDYSYETKKVWSIAIHHEEQFKHFYAENWSQEKSILREFLKFLKQNKEAHLYSYSGFDKSVLKFAFTRHKLDANFFLSCNHFDLCSLIKRHYVFPLNNYGLKTIGKHLGYEFKSEHVDGLNAAIAYIHAQRHGKKLPKDIFHYIEDDVKVMNHIVKQLQSRRNIKVVFDHSTKD